jgi:uncharacterized HAD superfamily protein
MEPRFAIDLDGVLADFGNEVVKATNRIWPNRLPLGYLAQNWDFSEVLSKGEWKQVWTSIIQTENLWLNEEELPGARVLDKFFQRFPLAQCYFISSRAETKGFSPLVQSCLWLEKRNLWARFGRSVVTVVNKPEQKLEIIRDLKIPFFLDDYAPTIQQLQSIEGLQAFVLDAPYNRYPTSIPLPRVETVAEYLNIVSGATF